MTIQATGLTGNFGGDFKGTVFAPNNAAFDNLLNELGLELSVLLDPRSKDLVTKVCVKLNKLEKVSST